MKPYLARLLLLLTAMLWGFSFVVMKDASDVLPVFLLLALRFSVAFVVLALVFFKKLQTVTRTDLLFSAAVALSIFLAYVFQTYGLTDTTPGKNAFLTAVYCVLVPFLSWITDRKRPALRNVLAAVLCFVGIALLSFDGNLSLRLGDGLTLVGGFFYAVQIVLLARVCRKCDPCLVTVLQFGFSAVFCWLGVAFTGESFPAFSAPLAGQVLFLALFATAAAFLMQNIGQKYTSSAAAALLLSLESVFGVFFSVLLGYETPTPRLYAGFAVIFLSVLLNEAGDRLFRKKGSQAP